MSGEARVASAKGDGVCVFLEQTSGALEQVSLEVLGKAREIADRLGAPVTALILGEGVEGLAREAAGGGADRVLFGESPLLKDFTSEAYLKVVSQLVSEKDPDMLLIGATHNGTTLAAGLAIRLGAGLMAHVVDLEIEDATGMLLGSVPGFGGSIVAVCKCKRGRPQMATVRPGVFKPLPPGASRVGTVEPIPVNLKGEDVKCRIVEKAVGQSADISRAEKVVVVGLGGKADLSLPKKLANAMGASVAFSRPLADKGIITKDLVVGSTGSSLNAKLAVVMGVSGAAHFASGIRDVKTVIAVNSDPQAPIFKHADYCVTGDLFEIVPMLLSEFESSGGATT